MPVHQETASPTIIHFLLHGVPAQAGCEHHQRQRRLEGLGLQELLELQQCRQPIHVLLCNVLTLGFGGEQQHEAAGAQELLLGLHSVQGAVAESTVGYLDGDQGINQ